MYLKCVPSLNWGAFMYATLKFQVNELDARLGAGSFFQYCRSIFEVLQKRRVGCLVTDESVNRTRISTGEDIPQSIKYRRHLMPTFSLKKWSLFEWPQ